MCSSPRETQMGSIPLRTVLTPASDNRHVCPCSALSQLRYSSSLQPQINPQRARHCFSAERRAKACIKPLQTQARLSPMAPLNALAPQQPHAALNRGCRTTQGTGHDLGIYPQIICTLSWVYRAELLPRGRASWREHGAQSSHRCSQFLSH